MTTTFEDTLNRIKALKARPDGSQWEKDLVRQLVAAMQAIDRRLAKLEQTSVSAPISDTPQGETAPLSR